MRGLEPRVSARLRQEAAEEEQGGSQKQRRSGNLRDHERVAHQRGSRTERSLHAYGGYEIDSRGLERGQQSRHDAGEDDEHRRKADEPAIAARNAGAAESATAG